MSRAVSDRKHQQAQRRLGAFEEQFEDEAYREQVLDLASHAAFPLTLTTDLMYCLRENFFPDCRWIASPDILLSGLCNSVGYDLYEMAAATKIALLKRLLERFGEGRLANLEVFMGDYIQHHLALNPKGDRILNVGEPGAPLKWTALALLRPGDLYDRIRQDLQTLLQGRNPKDCLRFASLVETYADLLPIDLLAEYRPLFLDLADQVAEGQPPDADMLSLEQSLGITLKTEMIETATLEAVSERDQSDRVLVQEVETVTLDEQKQVVERRRHEVSYYREVLADDGPALNMIVIPSNEFWMGTDKDAPEYQYDDETPKHQVFVSPFWMSQYPITQAQWRVVSTLPKENRELSTEELSASKDDHPVENVSWDDAVEFCDRLSRKTGRTYRLPSEAEWEYACRAGTETAYHFGPTITKEYVNYGGGGTTPVGQHRIANAFGLSDMHGNVWEWCQDYWHKNYQGAPLDGRAWLEDPLHNNRHVRRGGSWAGAPSLCRSAYRFNDHIDIDDAGLRVVVSAPGLSSP